MIPEEFIKTTAIKDGPSNHSSDKIRKFPLNNQEVARYFETNEALEFSKNIFELGIPSERHNKIFHGYSIGRVDLGINSKICVSMTEKYEILCNTVSL